MESKRSKQTVRQSKKGPPSVYSPGADQESPAPCVRVTHYYRAWKVKPTFDMMKAIECLGGEFWIESAGHGKGCTFWIRFSTKRRYAAQLQQGNECDIWFTQFKEALAMQAAMAEVYKSREQEAVLLQAATEGQERHEEIC